MSARMPGFQSFSMFLASFRVWQIGPQQHKGEDVSAHNIVHTGVMCVQLPSAMARLFADVSTRMAAS